MMDVSQQILQLDAQFKRATARLPLVMGNEAVNFTLDNFRLQGFMGNTFQRWVSRKQGWKKDRRSNRAILIDKGRLRRSIRITSLSAAHVAIGTDVKYARAHNEGLRIGLIQTVKGFTRRNGSSVSAHTRRIDQRIPKRQFMGDSPYLRARLKRVATLEYMKEIRFLKP
jgi:phage gpG-like protein